MTYLLDTNTCVVYLRGKNAKLRTRVDTCPPADIALCSIVLGELYYGADKSSNPAAGRAAVDAFAAPFACLSFDRPEASAYAGVRANLESRGLVIGANDMLIAAIGLVHSLTVVTHNTAEFGRVPGLQIEDWEV